MSLKKFLKNWNKIFLQCLHCFFLKCDIINEYFNQKSIVMKQKTEINVRKVKKSIKYAVLQF